VKVLESEFEFIARRIRETKRPTAVFDTVEGFLKTLFADGAAFKALNSKEASQLIGIYDSRVTSAMIAEDLAQYYKDIGF